MNTESNKCLWQPSSSKIEESVITDFMSYIQEHFDVAAKSYDDLYQWSVNDKESFWQAIWRFSGVVGAMGKTTLKHANKMPGAQWFPEASLNFSENLLRYAGDSYTPNKNAIIERGEHGRREILSFKELHTQVAYIAQYLKQQGVVKGDRVAGFLPNGQFAVIAMLATSSLGAVWTSCSPDFGVTGVLDRFAQTAPKVLFASDGYYYGGKCISSLERVNQISSSLPGLQATVLVPYLNASDQTPLQASYTNWNSLCQGGIPALDFEQVDFSDPLYILYSSGTTGKPKCIVHSVGGTLLQHLKELALHSDIKASSTLFYYSTCGWMMWNWLVSGLALGATVVLFDGSPFHPEKSVLFDMADEEGISCFGASAKYYAACEKFGLNPKRTHSLTSVDTFLSTGSPLSHESFDYLYQSVKEDVCVSSISGGTDIISCFALGCPILPVYQGELQCIGLGMDVKFVDDDGTPLQQGKGELVCQQTFPSIPTSFWQDSNGEKFHQAYFNRFDNVWAHGDYGELVRHPETTTRPAQTGVIIHGRSDAVLNPGGVRIGTAEIYRQVEKIESVFESIAIGQEWQDDVRVVLFVRLQDGLFLNDVLVSEIKQSIRQNTTPRHVPSKVIQVADIPRTLSGKIVELAVRSIVHGKDVSNKEALANPDALDLFKDLPELQLD
jgi:acetoacetyl-CoA synthetase